MARYNVTADHDKRHYAVIDSHTGCVVATFSYKPTELDRGVAHGRANIAQNQLNSGRPLSNDEPRKRRPKRRSVWTISGGLPSLGKRR